MNNKMTEIGDANYAAWFSLKQSHMCITIILFINTKNIAMFSFFAMDYELYLNAVPNI